MFVFKGAEFDSNPDCILFKSLMIDTFHGETMPKINLAGIERVIVCTYHEGKILWRQYSCGKKKSGTKFPKIVLEEMGPHMDLSINRVKNGSEEILKAAMKVPRAAKEVKTKNIERGTLGDQIGRIHINQQDINTIGLAKTKALGKRKRSTKSFEAMRSSSSSKGSDEFDVSIDANGMQQDQKPVVNDGNRSKKDKKPRL
jgi:ribosome production factor 2